MLQGAAIAPTESSALSCRCFIISSARFPGLQTGDGLRLIQLQALAGGGAELLATLMHLLQTTPNDFSLPKKSNGKVLSLKLSNGSQVFEDGG
jgi:hypothetical protein